MKKYFVILALFLVQYVSAQGVGINEDGSAPHGSAILDVKSSDKGLLLPRLTNAQRDNITNPAAGLYIFNSSTGKMNYFNGDFWVSLPQSDCPYKIMSSLKELSEPTGVHTFSIEANSSITDYVWTVPSGWNIVSGQGTNEVQLEISSLSGAETVSVSLLENDVEQCFTQYSFNKALIKGGMKTYRVSDGSFGILGATYEMCVFNYLGDNDTLTVFNTPVGGTIEVLMWGAGGGFGSFNGGSGGFTTGKINVAPGDKFVIRTGGSGVFISSGTAPVPLTSGPYPGGGGAYGIAGTGGGYSGLFDLTLNPILIAGGGGGGGFNTVGGSGGGATGIAGTTFNSSATGGGGGTQSAGGAAGTGTSSSGFIAPTAGSAYQGGNGGRYATDQGYNGGGGGGGYFGGGGGFGYYGCGGGGGSSFIAGTVISGSTASNAGITPPMSNHALLPPGYAFGGSSTSNTGGNGIVIVLARMD